MRTDAQRIGAYISKTVAGTVGLKIAAMLEGMKTGFTSAAESLVPLETQCQALLNGLGTVPSCDYPFYMSFVRELWARQYKGIDGDGLVGFAITCCAKWTAYGLVEANLQAIALTLFGIVIP